MDARLTPQLTPVWNIYLLEAQSIYLRRRWTPPEALTTFGNHTAKNIGFLIDTSKTLNDLEEQRLLELQQRIEDQQRQERKLAQRKLHESQNSWFGPGTIFFASLFAIIVIAIALYCGCRNRQALRSCCAACCPKPQKKDKPLNTNGHHNHQPDDDEHFYASAGPIPAPRTANETLA